MINSDTLHRYTETHFRVIANGPDRVSIQVVKYRSMWVRPGDTQAGDDGIDRRFEDHKRTAVGLGIIIVFLHLNKEMRVHGLEAHDVVEAGLVDAQPLQRLLHVRSIRVREQLRAYD